jgi:hypothetical protein
MYHKNELYIGSLFGGRYFVVNTNFNLYVCKQSTGNLKIKKLKL